MTTSSQPERLFLSTTPGLEPALEREAKALGHVEAMSGGFELTGPAGLHRRANLELRTATRVLLRLANLPPTSSESQRLSGFQRLAQQWPLRELAGATVRAEAKGMSLRSDSLEREFRKALRWKESGPDEVLLRASREGISVSIETSGELLHRRGYRQEISHAPLRETLAAGVLLLADFSEDEPLIDPMCGSGTLVIEAALLATRRAPGLQRAFAFEFWKGHDAAAWAREKEEATRRIRPPTSKLFGSDLHAGALGTARRNAKRAGVVDLLTLERRDVAELKRPEGRTGLVVANPPYGKRVGERGDLPTLYKAFGATLREQFKGWRAAVLIPDAKLGAALGLTPTQVHAVDNGGIHLQLWLVNL